LFGYELRKQGKLRKDGLVSVGDNSKVYNVANSYRLFYLYGKSGVERVLR
jgi:hypothetical protein